MRWVKWNIRTHRTLGGSLRVNLVRSSWGTGKPLSYVFFPLWPLGRPFRLFCVALALGLLLMPFSTVQAKSKTPIPSVNKAGNYSVFKKLIREEGFFYDGTIGHFEMYVKPRTKPMEILVTARSCKGDFCEGSVIAKPMTLEELRDNLLLIYMPLLYTMSHRDGQKVASSEVIVNRLEVLVKMIFINLARTNLSEFSFDGLNVRVRCDPVPDADFKRGKRPWLAIKLWIP
jgi:hypothetical protein